MTLELFFSTIAAALKQFDAEMLLAVNGLNTPWLDQIMWVVTNRFAWIPLYVALAVYIVRPDWRKGLTCLIFIGLLILAVDQTIASLIRPVVGRLRPSWDTAMFGDSLSPCQRIPWRHVRIPVVSRRQLFRTCHIHYIVFPHTSGSRRHDSLGHAPCRIKSISWRTLSGRYLCRCHDRDRLCHTFLSPNEFHHADNPTVSVYFGSQDRL